MLEQGDISIDIDSKQKMYENDRFRTSFLIQLLKC